MQKVERETKQLRILFIEALNSSINNKKRRKEKRLFNF